MMAGRRRMGATAGLALLCWASQVGFAIAQSAPAKPRLPPGRDPGGVLIGLLTTGIDPTVLAVARCLARDGEGELIGWDMVDRDRRPYRPAVAGQAGDEAQFQTLPCEGRVRVAPVRIDPADGITFGKALAFLSTTPARVVVVPETSLPADWTLFRQAATSFSQLLILIEADAKPQAVEDVLNIVAVTRGSAMGQAAGAAPCGSAPQSTAPCR